MKTKKVRYNPHTDEKHSFDWKGAILFALWVMVIMSALYAVG